VCLGVWVALLLFKLPFGYTLKWAAHHYTQRYSSAHHGKMLPRSVMASATVGGGLPPPLGGGRGAGAAMGSSRRETPRGGDTAHLVDALHPSRQKQE
jgi:hypothetical protein